MNTDNVKKIKISLMNYVLKDLNHNNSIRRKINPSSIVNIKNPILRSQWKNHSIKIEEKSIKNSFKLFPSMTNNTIINRTSKTQKMKSKTEYNKRQTTVNKPKTNTIFSLRMKKATIREYRQRALYFLKGYANSLKLTNNEGLINEDKSVLSTTSNSTTEEFDRIGKSSISTKAKTTKRKRRHTTPTNKELELFKAIEKLALEPLIK